MSAPFESTPANTKGPSAALLSDPPPMAYAIACTSLAADPELGPFLDAAFERPGREASLLAALEHGDPRHDPSLSFFALDQHKEKLGYALFARRRVRFFGTPVDVGLCALLCTHPKHRRRGVARFLLRTGLGALAERGAVAALALGAPECFRSSGFVSALGQETTTVRRSDLLAEGDDPWRGLAGEDLSALVKLREHCHRAVPFWEERLPAAQDFASAIPSGHTLVLERARVPVAYLRFCTRGGLELRECAAADGEAVEAILRFLARLLKEHGRASLEAYLPHQHPVSQALFERGALAASHGLAGAGLLAVLDWRRWLEAQRSTLERRLAASGEAPLVLEVEGAELALGSGGAGARRLRLTSEAATALLLGRLGNAALVQSGVGDGPFAGAVSALAPPAPSAWHFAPAMELAED